MATYEGTVRNVTLDLLLYRMGNDWLHSVWGNAVHWFPPHEGEVGGYREAHLAYDAGAAWVTVLQKPEDYEDQPFTPLEQKEVTWRGTIMQTPATPRYSAQWNFTHEDGGGDGWLFLDQWQTNEVQLYGWYYERIVSEEFRPTFELLATWLSEHYDHDFRRLELTPEQESQIENAKSEDERMKIVKEINRRTRDKHNQEAIDRIENGEPPWKVMIDWREAFYQAKDRYPNQTKGGESDTWKRNVTRHVDWVKAEDNRQKRKNSPEK